MSPFLEGNDLAQYPNHLDPYNLQHHQHLSTLLDQFNKRPTVRKLNMLHQPISIKPPSQG